MVIQRGKTEIFIAITELLLEGVWGERERERKGEREKERERERERERAAREAVGGSRCLVLPVSVGRWTHSMED